MTPDSRAGRSARRRPVNARGDLVGEEDAERLGIDDDDREALATMALGAVLVVVAVVVLVQAVRLPDGSQPVGPGDAPLLVGLVMLAVAVGLMVSGRRAMGGWEHADHAGAAHWLRLLGVLGVLVGFAIVIPVLGYVVSTAALFGAAAVLLGSPHRLRSFAYGWIVAALTFLAFDTLIGLSLPAGPWGF